MGEVVVYTFKFEFLEFFENGAYVYDFTKIIEEYVKNILD